MNLPDIVAVATASAALTAAVLLPLVHAYNAGRRRQLARVRAQRDAALAENRELRADRPAVHRTLAEHARQAVAVTEPIPYRLADPTTYLPAFAGDNTAVTEYVQLRDASRRARRVSF